jgi:hypothetical protein
MRSPLATLAAAALLLGACSYDFSNPAEKLDAGEVAGRVVADSGSGLAGLSGVDVRLRNSASFSTQVTRPNGRFILLGLMPGRHTVQFELKNLITPTAGWATTRDVEVVWGSDGQPEGTLVGDVRAYSAVSVGGAISIPVSAISGGFAFLGGYAVDDLTGAIGAVTGSAPNFTYLFTSLSVGLHRFRIVVTGTELGGTVATSYGIGPIDREIMPGEAGTTLPPLPSATGAPTSGFGKLRFKVNAPPALVAGLGYTATVSRVAPTTTEYCSVYSDGTRECDLSAGVYTITVAPNGGSYTGPAALTGIVSADQTTELGSIYITDDALTSLAVSGCIADADCYSMQSCQSGQCVSKGGAQPVACLVDSSTATTCSPFQAYGFCSLPTNGTAVQCNSGAGVCGMAPGGIYVCVPNGQLDCRYDIYLVPRPPCPL